MVSSPQVSASSESHSLKHSPLQPSEASHSRHCHSARLGSWRGRWPVGGSQGGHTAMQGREAWGGDPGSAQRPPSWAHPQDPLRAQPPPPKAPIQQLGSRGPLCSGGSQATGAVSESLGGVSSLSCLRTGWSPGGLRYRVCRVEESSWPACGGYRLHPRQRPPDTRVEVPKASDGW